MHLLVTKYWIEVVSGALCVSLWCRAGAVEIATLQVPRLNKFLEENPTFDRWMDSMCDKTISCLYRNKIGRGKSSV